MTSIPAQRDPTPLAESWLLANDWIRLNPDGSRLAVYSKDQAEVAVPLLVDAPDFGLRWSELVADLARLRHTNSRAVLDEFTHEGADISEWAASHPVYIDETIPLSTLHTFTGSVRSSVIAAANATLSPRGHFGHSVPQQARDAASHARAGQTREGSYVIPVISPVPRDPQPSQATLGLDVSVQPYARRVMMTLSNALATVHTLAVESGREPSQKTLNESVAMGVSHELCAAVADTLEDESIGVLSVNFKWARAIPTTEPQRGLEFPAEARQVVRNMAEELRHSETAGTQSLVGTVRKTELVGDEDLRSAVIRTTLGGVERSVRLFLDPDQFHLATEAIDQSRPIFARGEIERRSGAMWIFRSVEDFGPIERLGIAEIERILNG